LTLSLHDALTIYSTENMIEVDNFKGLFQSRIQSEYMNKGYHIEFRWWDFGEEKGKAWAQDPAPGEYVKPGDTVYVWISVPGKNIHPPPGRDDDDRSEEHTS